MSASDHAKRFTESVVWVKQMLPNIDFAQEEMNYKVKSAERIAAARNLLEAKDPEWVAAFAGAFAGSNLLDWRYTDELIRMAETQPEVLAPLLQLLWGGSLTEASFNRFVWNLRTYNSALSLGIGTAVASVLLMARGAANHPPYRPQAVQRFWKTVGWPATRNDENPFGDYQNFRESLQVFRKIASANGLSVENLLTAQGYMWLITEWDPRTVLPASDIATFRAWRGDPYTGATFEDTKTSARRIRILEQLDRNKSHLFTRNGLVSFTVDNEPVEILHPSHGTIKPQGFDVPVSLTLPLTVFSDTLISAIDDTGILRYHRRHQNTSSYRTQQQELLSALEARVPLIIFAPIGDDTYQAVFPVYLHRYLYRDQVFELDFSAAYLPFGLGSAPEYERRWTVGTARQRVHQPVFRRDVMQAYNNQCAVCGLGIAHLLDAAHIIPDRDEHGIASVTNGIALCKNHHAAFDGGLLAVTEDLTIQISAPVMSSEPGEAIDRILRDYDGRKLAVIPFDPARRPNPKFLISRRATFH